jgi:iron complex outermembrane recepter protein
MKRTTLWCAVAAALGTGGFGAPVVLAQSTLDEIVVTANRREQDLQEVPVSIVAVTGENLELRGLTDLESLNGTVPNLNVMGSTGGSGTTATSFTVRGIPNVGTYVDGIWQVGVSGFLTQEFVDLERIEVLRGPQGTLYGRDSVGGAIRIITKRPNADFGGSVKATLGTYDRRDVTASIDVPVSDTLLTKWTVSSLERDGYLNNQQFDQKNGSLDQDVFRGDILWTPTDRLDARFIYNKNENSFTEPRVQDAIFLDAVVFPTNIIQLYTAAGAPITNQTQTSGFPGGDVGLWESNSSITLPNIIDTEQSSLEINFQLTDNISLQSLTGFVEQNVRNFVDYENTQYALVEDLVVSKRESFSQEFQLSGGTDRFDWVAGAFYWDQEIRSRNLRYAAEEFKTGELSLQTALDSDYCQQFAADAPGPSGNCQNAYNFFAGFANDSLTQNKQDGYAFFGEGTYMVTDQFSVTLGMRYHDQDNYAENLVYTAETAPKPLLSNTSFLGGNATAGVSGGAGSITPSSFDKTTGRVSAQYVFNDDLMVYGSYAQGFNSGGVSIVNVPGANSNPDTTLVLPFEPESLDTYEFGVRSDMMDGRLRINATLFHTVWSDIQASGVVRHPTEGYDLPGLSRTNIGEAEADGAEFEITFLATDSLTLNANIGLLDTEYTDIANGTQGFPDGGASSVEFSQAPELTYNLGIQHDLDINSGGSLTSRIDYTYSDDYRRSPNPTLRADYYNGVPAGFDKTGDFGMLNARFTYIAPSDNWELSLFGTNLTNEYILNSGFFHGIWGVDFATVARPREAGLSLKVYFD